MPDPFDFDDARRALDEVPAPDLWDEATRRADAGGVVSLTTDGGGDRRRPSHRWLAVAAVAAVSVLAVGTAAVDLDDDEAEQVDSGPSSDGGVVPLVPPTMDFSAPDGTCPFALDSPQPYPEGDGGLTTTDSGQPEQQRQVSLRLGDEQLAGIAVPGMVVTDLVGERVEDVELARGTGQVWFADAAVQVRWFPGGQDLCESFTVTVGGGTEDGNRHAAVDLADQVLLPSDLEVTLAATLDGEWELEGGHLRGEPFDGGDLAFSFADGAAAWSDGCNQQSGAYEATRATAIRIPTVEATAMGCAGVDEATEAIHAVMNDSEIAVSTTPDELVLTQGVGDGVLTELRLRPAEARDDDPEDDQSALVTIEGEWQLERSEVGGDATEGTGLVFTFAGGAAGWSDGCNSFGGGYGPVDHDGTVGAVTFTDVTSTAIGCEPNPTADAVQSVMGASQVQVTMEGDLLVLSAGDAVLALRPLVGDDGEASSGRELAGSEWRVVSLSRGDEEVALNTAAPALTFSFGDDSVSWHDGCNSLAGAYTVDADGYLIVTDANTTKALCADVGEGPQVWEVIGAVMGAERIYMDEMGGLVELSGPDKDHITLEPA